MPVHVEVVTGDAPKFIVRGIALDEVTAIAVMEGTTPVWMLVRQGEERSAMTRQVGSMAAEGGTLIRIPKRSARAPGSANAEPDVEVSYGTDLTGFERVVPEGSLPIPRLRPGRSYGVYILAGNSGRASQQFVVDKEHASDGVVWVQRVPLVQGGVGAVYAGGSARQNCLATACPRSNVPKHVCLC